MANSKDDWQDLPVEQHDDWKDISVTDGPAARESVFDALKQGGLSGAYNAMKANKTAYDQDVSNGVIKKPIGDDLGAAGLTIPMGSAPAGLAKLATYLGGKGIGPMLGRIAANTGVGAVQGGAKGAATGAIAGTAGEALGALMGAGQNVYQTIRKAANPAAAQDEAVSAITNATDKLKSSESENLSNYLGGKSLKIDTTRIRGIHPEIDSILSEHASNLSPYGDIPSELEIPAQDANKIRSLLDQEMTYKKLGPFAQTAETAQRDAAIKPLADQLRGQIHELSPEISDTLEQWSDNLNAARNLDKRAETAPMTVLSSPSFDRRALLQKVDQEAGTNLEGLGRQITNAKDLSNAFHNGVHPIDAALATGRAGLQGAVQGNEAAVPIEVLLQGLFSKAGDAK